MSDHLDIGLQGELLACTHLQEQGFTILQKNWRYQRAEIDIICKKDGVLAFVEVKTRTSDYLGNPVEAVGKNKQKHIIRAAHAFMSDHEGEEEVRFDIIGVVLNEKGFHLEHFEDAFYPML